MTKIVFRNATLNDIDEIMKIEKESFDINIIEPELLMKFENLKEHRINAPLNWEKVVK